MGRKWGGKRGARRALGSGAPCPTAWTLSTVAGFAGGVRSVGGRGQQERSGGGRTGIRASRHTAAGGQRFPVSGPLEGEIAVGGRDPEGLEHRGGQRCLHR